VGGLATLVVVWLGAEKPDSRAKAGLDAWAAARYATVEPARVEPIDDGEAARVVAERCEHALEEARDQMNGGDDGAARRTLGSVEQELRDHPELLQASWLMAERCRLEAQIALHAGAVERAATWIERADALEGARALSFGEAARGEIRSSSVSVAVDVHGARAHETYWDGARTDDRFSTARGEHHLAIVRGKRLAWSGWVSALSAAKLDVWIADAPPCSVEDLDGAEFSGDTQVQVPSAVRCDAWAVAEATTEGTIRAALCHRATCERASILTDMEVASPSQRPDRRTFPPWATWTIAGVGVAAVTSLVLWQAGAFRAAEPAKKVVYDGSGL
jgi:hypothetical protein